MTINLLPTPAINPKLVLRPLTPGAVIDGGPTRAIVSDPGMGLDTFAPAGGSGPLSFLDIDFIAGARAENYGAVCAGPIYGIMFDSCSFQNWNAGIAAETGLDGFLVRSCHFTGCGAVSAIFGNARNGTIALCVFDRGGWNPQGVRQDPAQQHHLYINPDNCDTITIDGCLFNDGRMNATRCCGTVCKKSVFINNGCGALGGKITRSIVSNVVTLTHDPAPGLPVGGMGINADSPNGLVISGNVVAHAGTGSTGNLYGVGVHGGYSNVAINGNKVFDWAIAKGGSREGVGIGWGANPGVNCQCTGNQVQMPNGGKCVEVHSGNIANIRFGQNLYWSPDPKPFRFNGVDRTWEEWVQLTGDTTSQFVRVEYADSGRTAARYVAEELGLTVTDPGAQIAAAARLYPGLIQQFARYMRDGFAPA